MVLSIQHCSLDWISVHRFLTTNLGSGTPLADHDYVIIELDQYTDYGVSFALVFNKENIFLCVGSIGALPQQPET